MSRTAKSPLNAGERAGFSIQRNEVILMQKAKVYQFPKRGRFERIKPAPMTPERKATGQQWLAEIRALIEGGRHE